MLKVARLQDRTPAVAERHRFILYTRRSGGTAHESGGCAQSIGSTVSDAIVRSQLWSTATRSSPLGYFSNYCNQLIIDPTFCGSRFLHWEAPGHRRLYLLFFLLKVPHKVHSTSQSTSESSQYTSSTSQCTQQISKYLRKHTVRLKYLTKYTIHLKIPHKAHSSPQRTPQLIKYILHLKVPNKEHSTSQSTSQSTQYISKYLTMYTVHLKVPHKVHLIYLTKFTVHLQVPHKDHCTPQGTSK